MKNNTVAQTFAAYRDRLLRFIQARTKRLEDAEDILQEVFYQYARMNDLARPIEQTAAWLYRVARNNIIDRRKKKTPAPPPIQRDEDADEDGDILDDIADIAYGAPRTPETEHLRALIFQEIDAALAELPAEQRIAFELTQIAGLTVKEVARYTHTPINTVLSRKHYAVKRLRARLARLYGDIVGPV
ncbi:MAG: RNA polymerase sigma factor [Spirochaetaceae bacterium]|nr:RNA polymerase sigma factor [Spirochaetaceae bacterium]